MTKTDLFIEKDGNYTFKTSGITISKRDIDAAVSSISPLERGLHALRLGKTIQALCAEQIHTVRLESQEKQMNAELESMAAQTRENETAKKLVEGMFEEKRLIFLDRATRKFLDEIPELTPNDYRNLSALRMRPSDTQDCITSSTVIRSLYSAVYFK